MKLDIGDGIVRNTRGVFQEAAKRIQARRHDHQGEKPDAFRQMASVRIWFRLGQ